MCNLCRYYYRLTHSLTFLPDSRDLGTRERERESERKKKVIKGRKEIVIAVTNKEPHFDWIIHSPYGRHSTVSFIMTSLML
jgi:hypothetical protein